MTQDGIVVAERVLELFENVFVALDVHANIMCFNKFLNGVSQLATPPIFEAVNGTITVGNRRLIAFDHGGYLFALIRVHDEHDFVVTHFKGTPCGYLLVEKSPPKRQPAQIKPILLPKSSKKQTILPQ